MQKILKSVVFLTLFSSFPSLAAPLQEVKFGVIEQVEGKCFVVRLVKEKKKIKVCSLPLFKDGIKVPPKEDDYVKLLFQHGKLYRVNLIGGAE